MSHARWSRRLLGVGAVLLLSSLSASASAQSAFTRAPGSVYAKLGYTYFSSNDYWDLGGVLRDRGERFTQHSLSLYGEVGLVDHLNAIVSFPALKVNHFANTNRAVGVGDLQIGFKLGTELGRGLKLAAMVIAEFPTGDSGATVQTETGANLILPTGDGEYNTWTMVALSRSIAPIHGWFNLYFGLNARNSGFANQLQVGGELGHHLLDMFYIQIRARLQVVPSDDLDVAAGFIFGEGTEFFSVGAGIAYPVPHTPIAITFDWEQAVAYRQNLYTGPVLTFGVAYEYDP